MTTQTKTKDSLSNASLMDERLLDRAEEDDGFDVSSEADAQKAFRAIKAAEQKIEQLTAQMEEQIDEIKDFYEPRIERQVETIAFLKAKITGFVESTGESVSVPSGKAHTTSRTKWDWQVSRDKLVQFAQAEYPDLVETTKKVSKRDLKSAIKDDWDQKYEDDPPVVERRQVESVRCYTT